MSPMLVCVMFNWRTEFHPFIGISCTVTAFRRVEGSPRNSCVMLRSWLLAVLNLAVANENQINHVFVLASGRFVFAGTHGAEAVSGDCFNTAVIIGLEVASWSAVKAFGHCVH